MRVAIGLQRILGTPNGWPRARPQPLLEGAKIGSSLSGHRRGKPRQSGHPFSALIQNEIRSIYTLPGPIPSSISWKKAQQAHGATSPTAYLHFSPTGRDTPAVDDQAHVPGDVGQ